MHCCRAEPDRLIGTTPESRNEKLASSFRRFRICEERGTGFRGSVTAIELFGLPPLVLRRRRNAFRVTIGAPRKFADMSASERIEACYQHAVLQYLSSETLQTNTTLRQRFHLHDKTHNQVTNLIGDAVMSHQTQGHGQRQEVRRVHPLLGVTLNTPSIVVIGTRTRSSSSTRGGCVSRGRRCTRAG